MIEKFNKQKKWFLFSGVFLFILFSLLITIGESFGLISWKSVYNGVGVSDFSQSADDYDMSVHFIDVGKADSIYIKCLGKNVLIDAGEKATYDVVGEYLKKNGVKKLDLVIATHPHSDHIGGMPDVLNDFSVERFLMPELKAEYVPTSKCYEKLLLALKNNNITPENPEPGSSFEIGEMEFDIFAPNSQYEELNNDSIVAKVSFRNQSFLFTGDAQIESENEMLARNFNLSSTVLKVGHHGSKTSTSDKFLKKVNPKYAVISVNSDMYNLPNKKIVKKLKNWGIETYRTDLNGTVILATNGENITVIKEK
ncbi:MAG: hypothetical protein RUMPE_00847 [Eubacteriales bacterium SKADARSKE-1]|nr:hypothetical protein [Eubacteriales bacterium SKADARSKE-1]